MAEETVLVVDAMQDLVALSTAAFSISGRKKERIERLYIGATVLHRAGCIRKVRGIKFLGPWGDSIAMRLFSALNGNHRIEVQWEDVPGSRFQELKALIAQALPGKIEVEESQFKPPRPLQEMLRRIGSAANCSELFDEIGMPAPEDALDILC